MIDGVIELKCILTDFLSTCPMNYWKELLDYPIRLIKSLISTWNFISFCFMCFEVLLGDLRLCLFFSSIFYLCCSYWEISVILASSSLIISSVLSILLLNPSFEIFILVFIRVLKLRLIVLCVFCFFPENFCFLRLL